MKKYTFAIAMLTVAMVGMGLSSCSKTELDHSDKTTDTGTTKPVTPTDDNATAGAYRFDHNGTPSVDISEYKQVLLDFRSFNNGINAKVLSNLTDEQAKYTTKLRPYVATDMEESRKTQTLTLLDTLVEDIKSASTDNGAQRQARPGQIGVWQVSNDEQRLVNAKGVELGQVIQKMLMGALQLYQLEYHLDEALKADNSKLISKSGATYTMMEHHWDIAWSYLGSLDADPSRIQPLFLANYIEKEAVGMKGLENINTSIYKAFYLGRKAITQHNVEEAKKQAKNIRRDLANMMVKRNLFYFKESNKVLGKVGDNVTADYFHNMGEALGFLLALPYVQNAEGQYMVTPEQAVGLFDGLTSGDDGIWNLNKMKASEGTAGSISHAIVSIIQWTNIE